jgi:hypothetical protein
MKEQKSEKSSGKNKSSSDRSNNPKEKNIVNEQEQQNVVNPQQELHEQDRPSGDYVSEREMSRESQEKADTDRSTIDKTKNYDTNEMNSGTNAENAKEKFKE